MRPRSGNPQAIVYGRNVEMGKARAWKARNLTTKMKKSPHKLRHEKLENMPFSKNFPH